MHEQAILVLNCGSSSLKFGTYRSDGVTATLLYEGEAEEIGGGSSSFWVVEAGHSNRKIDERVSLPDHGAALACALESLQKCSAPAPQAIGHRIVHGGPTVREHRRFTEEVRIQLYDSVNLAPLHLPPALAVLEAIENELPQVPQIICLDTAFHRTLPEAVKTYALPAEVRELGVERYGFHGLSLESIIAQLEPVPERLVVAHLGSGCSVTGILNGAPVDTTMGFTTSGGPMMGTRCGDLDPGVLLFLMRNGYDSADKLERVIDHKSGLLGVSGKTSDVRELLQLRKQDAKAGLALRMLCHQIRRAVAAMTAALGGLDELVFTGGIGEHATELRSEICAGLEHLLNGSRPIVLPSQEDLQIARITAKLCA
jgi:acetate kinase